MSSKNSRKENLQIALGLFNNPHVSVTHAAALGGKDLLSAVDSGALAGPPLYGVTEEGHTIVCPHSVRVTETRGLIRLRRARVGLDGLPRFPDEALSNGDTTTDNNDPLAALV
ncbi:MAG TPA: hypothetical protein VMW29_04140 [Candidatus Bathyarchaeia archaeon]|nr:hypothetical protein [Candidatus Bathyarchaeia archaeon]